MSIIICKPTRGKKINGIDPIIAVNKSNASINKVAAEQLSIENIEKQGIQYAFDGGFKDRFYIKIIEKNKIVNDSWAINIGHKSKNYVFNSKRLAENNILGVFVFIRWINLKNEQNESLGTWAEFSLFNPKALKRTPNNELQEY